jgi:hypothetical protein
MPSKYKSMRELAMIAIAALLLAAASSAHAQTTATGVINGTLVNISGITLQFDTDPAGLTLSAAGTSAATANFGSVSAFGPLSGGVTRPSVTAANFTVRTIFDVQVLEGGLSSTTYTLTANLATPAPTGLNYKVDAVTLGTTARTIQTNGSYNTDVAHNMDLIVSTAAPGAGGPAVGAPITTVINFTATAN